MFSIISYYEIRFDSVINIYFHEHFLKCQATTQEYEHYGFGYNYQNDKGLTTEQ